MFEGKRLKFIVALSEHRHLGFIFVPYLVEPLSAYYSVRSIVRFPETVKYDYDFSPGELDIVRTTSKYTDAKLASKFSRSQNSNEFFNNVTSEYLNSHVMPYVAKHLYAVALVLMKYDIPVFEKEAKYANLYDEDLITVPDVFASGRFFFDRREDGTHYQCKVYLGDEPIQLINKKVRIVANDPCLLLVRNRLLTFNDLDAKKIAPFLERDTILVPKGVETKYYTNFVQNMVRDHDVCNKGFNIIKKDEDRQAILCLEQNIRNHPVLVVRLVYGEKELLLNDSREVVVSLLYRDDEYTFFKSTRNRQWEKGLVNFLTEKGLREEAGGYTFPNIDLLEGESAIYAVVSWLSKNHEEIQNRNIAIRQNYYSKNYFTGNQHLSFDLQQNEDWFDLYAIVQLGEYKFPFIKLRKYILNGTREFKLPDGEIAILPEEWFERYSQLIQLGKMEGDKLVFGKHFFNLLRHRVPGQIPEVLQQLEKNLRTSEKAAVPANLNANLRSYQITGYQWIYSLVINGLGGCLADDMGLGKTLQTLALLLSLKKAVKPSFQPGSGSGNGQLKLFDTAAPIIEFQPASLIVLPTSLVHNWVNEIRKFAPDLSWYIHAGPLRNRDGALIEAVNGLDRSEERRVG